MLSLILAAHCLFTPPPSWEIADPKTPSKRVIVGFVDKSKSGFRPSLNLTRERVTIPLDEYLAIVQKNCEAKKQPWRHLGKIETQSGPAELIQIEEGKCSIEEPQNCHLPACGAICCDADIYILVSNLHGEVAILRSSLLCDIHLSQYLQP